MIITRQGLSDTRRHLSLWLGPRRWHESAWCLLGFAGADRAGFRHVFSDPRCLFSRYPRLHDTLIQQRCTGPWTINPALSLHRSVDNQPYFLAHGLVQADRPERGCPVWCSLRRSSTTTCSMAFPHGCALLPFNAFPGLTLGEHANGPRAHSVAIQGFAERRSRSRPMSIRPSEGRFPLRHGVSRLSI